MNYKQPSLLAALLALSFAVTAQKVTVKGTVADTSSNKSLKNAIVTLLSPTDSILRAFTRVKDDGSYSIENVKPGKYIFGISHPSFGEYIDDVTVGASGLTQAKIALTSKAKLLEAVIVKSKNPIRIKGDTTIYTADSFKVSANANVEELLKKLPGIQVDKNGEIKAMGEKVTKVLVDGEEFFGEDPGMAIKNLRADAVKEVQVFDKKSDQAEFTGIDDGKTQKTINLKLKDDRKRGYFGKVDAAGGLLKNIDDRYNTNLMYSSFLGKRKITGFLLNGNTGQDGLSWQDEQKFGGGDNEGMQFDEESGMTWFQGGGGNADEEPYVNTENGFIVNNNAGVQYSNKYNDKTSINFSPRFNEQRYNNIQDVNQQNNGVGGVNTTSREITNVNRKNLKLRGVVDSKIDSANSLKVTLTSNFYTSNSRVVDTAFTRSKAGAFLNKRKSDQTINSDKQAFGADVVFNHKFKKARRTISLNTNVNYLNNDAITDLISENDYAVEPDLFINQERDRDRQNFKLSSKVTYTEPINKEVSLEMGYQFVLSNSKNNLTTYNFNPTTSKYDLVDAIASNNFDQNITQNIPSTKISYNKKKFKANIGTGVSFFNFDLQDITNNKNFKRNYTNIFPTANVTYNYKSNHSLRFNYSGSNRQPTINDLQPLQNNANPNFVQIGNPNLNPTFVNRFAFTQNGYNFIKDMWNYQSLTLSFENNSITQNNTFDTSGKVTSQAINTNGNYSINFWGGMGFKAKKIDTRFFLSLNVNNNRFVSFQNSVKNISDNVNYGMNFNAQKSKEKKYDFSVDFMPSLNNQKNSATNVKSRFLTTSARANGTLYIKKVWSISTDYNLYNRPSVQGTPAITNHFLNARVQKTFKKDEFTAYVTVRDILNQNIGIDRSFNDNNFVETVNQRLRRYFMVGFAWNFKNKATAKK
jgi:Outer membrane protein beta-barrel family/Carboxypeptidase regulatory-like domain